MNNFYVKLIFEDPIALSLYLQHNKLGFSKSVILLARVGGTFDYFYNKQHFFGLLKPKTDNKYVKICDALSVLTLKLEKN